MRRGGAELVGEQLERVGDSGAVDYQQASITVTLDRPDSPRVAYALELLTDELSATPAHLPGDRRPLTYQLAQP